MPLTLRRKQNGGLDLRGGLGPELVGGADAAQAQCIALSRTQQGEWVFDLQFGIPYDDALLGGFFEEGTAAQLLASEYSALSAVADVPAESVAFVDGGDRLAYKIRPVYPVGDESFDFVPGAA